MAKEIDPKSTTRAKAFEFWMQAPNPMVTFFKTLNVTRLVKASKKHGLKFNMLMDYCIGKAAASVKEFYMLPVNGKLMQYDSIAVNTIVKNDEGEVSSCDIPYSEDLATFNRDYLKYTKIVAESCQDWDNCQFRSNSTTRKWTGLTPESSLRTCNKQLRNFDKIR